MALTNNEKTLIVWLIGLSFYACSALLGAEADLARTQRYDLHVLSSGGCVHKSSPARGWAISAALLHIVAQSFTTYMFVVETTSYRGHRYYWDRRDPPNKLRTVIFMIFLTSWWVCTASTYMFIFGASIEARGTNGNVDANCDIVEHKEFVIAFILILANSILAFAIFMLLTHPYPDNPPDGIAIAQAQLKRSTGKQQFQQKAHSEEPQSSVNDA